jgi:hypothetical protein
MNTEYREHLINSVQSLICFEVEMFTNALNIQMSGEYKDLSEPFEMGDVVKFKLSQLKASDDINVLKMVECIEVTRAAILSMINLNNLSEEELELVDDPE